MAVDSQKKLCLAKFYLNISGAVQKVSADIRELKSFAELKQLTRELEIDLDIQYDLSNEYFFDVYGQFCSILEDVGISHEEFEKMLSNIKIKRVEETKNVKK